MTRFAASPAPPRRRGLRAARKHFANWVPAFAGKHGVILALLLAGCGKPPPHMAQPRSAGPTIVSLNPCTDAVLAEVAGPEQLLALSHYSRDPRASSMEVARAREFGVTGGTVEEVLALKPDMVVASEFMPPATRAGLEGLGIRVETFGIASSVEQSDAQIRRLAALAGNALGGVALIAKSTRRCLPQPRQRTVRRSRPSYGNPPALCRGRVR